MASKFWAAPVNGNWSDATKWTGGVAPLTNDLITLGTGTQAAAFTVIEDVTQTINQLTMVSNNKSQNTTTLSLTPAAVLTVNGQIAFDGKSFINGAGTLVANGAITGAGTIIASNGGTLDVTGKGSIASGVVLDFDSSVSLASTLKLDLSGGITSALNIKMNNANQVLEIGPSTSLSIGVQETFSNGTVRMSGGTVSDALGIIVGGKGAIGNIVGFGTLAADLTGGGQKGQTNTVTASGGTLVLTGGFSPGAATFVAAIDTVAGSDLEFTGIANIAQAITINTASQTLEVGALGALTITGQEVVTFGTVRMDGGSLTDTSGIIIDTGATLVGKGTITAGTALSGDGIIKASGGTLELSDPLSALTPTVFEVDSAAGSVLKIDGAVASGTTLAFVGTSGVLELADVGVGGLQGFGGSIAGLNVGAVAAAPTNEINIQEVATSAVLSGNTITVFNGGTVVGTLALSAAPVHGAYALVQADAALGGTDVFLSNQPPVAPGTPDLAAGSDSGVFNTDNITNIATPLITGTGVAGDIITLLDGATSVGSTTVGVGGAWAITAATLVQGVNTLTATQSDAFGNASSPSGALNVTLDTVAPVVTATLVSDTGSSATDHITNNAALTGTADANSTVTIKNGGTVLGTAIAGAGGVWNFNPVLADGAYTLTASETDLANNTGSTTLAVTLDTTAPTVTAALVSDTGSSATDHITNNAALTGTADANSTVTIKNGGTVLGSVLAGAGGVWNFNPVLADGGYSLTASETDLANNTGSTTLAVTLDTTAPVVTAALVSDTGSSATDHITNNAALTGTAEAGRTVTISNGGTVLGSVLAGAGGVWNFNPVLANGSYSLTASETDLANNTGSTTLALTLDTTAPTVTAALVSDTGSSATDHITNNAALTGTAEAGRTVTISNGGTVLGSVLAGAGGVWNFNPVLADGAYTLTASETDLANNTGSTTLAFTLDTTAPTVTAALVLDTGSSATDHITNNVALTGTAEAGRTVTISNAGTVLGSVLAGAGGVWNFNPVLADGLYSLTASETDLANNTGSTTLAVTLDTTAPTVTAALVSDTGSSATDHITNNAALTGTAEAGRTVTISNAGTVLGSVLTGAGGVWNFNPVLADGAYTLTASETDLANNTGSTSLGFTLDTAAPAAPAIAQVVATAISGAAEANSTLSLFDGAAQIGATSTTGTGAWSIPVALAAGTHTLTATATDLSNNISAPSAAVTAVIGTAGDDTLSDGPGTVVMLGGAGNDTYLVGNALDLVTETIGAGTADTVVASVNYTLAAGSEVEFLKASGAAALTLTGNEFANTITGGAGNDTLNGGVGNDTFVATIGDGNDSYIGGTGTDTYDLSATTAGATVNLIAGTSTSTQTGTDTLNSIENVIGGSGNDSITANGPANVLKGGAGNDTYIVTNAGEQVIENASEGTDTVLARVSYTLLANSQIEALKSNTSVGITLTGNAFSHTITGGVGNDTLNGGAGADTLNGGVGADTMAGGAGNDTYMVDNALDVVNELPSQGIDTIMASVSYTLATGSEVENLDVNSTTGITLTGNELSHNLLGNVGNDILNGGIGNDVLTGGAGNDTLTGGDGNDRFVATTGDGNDAYDGGLGIDTYDLSGTIAGATVNLGLGTSASLTTGSDILTSIENVIGGSGADSFVASVGDGNNSYNGGTGTDTYDLSATTANAIVNLIAGTSTSAQTGTDTLTSIENVIGGSGDDSITANGPSNVLRGGVGNDTYIVTNAGEQVIENASEGTDTVLARVSYTLAATSEVEALKSNTSVGITLTGNAFSHTITGGVGNDTLNGGIGNDTLNGGVGADTMAGGAGNDTYMVDNALDVVNEKLGEGTDTVFASVNYALIAGQEIEFLRANAGVTGLTLTGNELANTVVGGAGSDTLDGGAGNDTLTGGAGSDIFRFNGGFGNDIVTDFVAGAGATHDVLDFSASIFGTFAAMQAAAQQGTTLNTTVITSAAGTLTLNVNKASLVAADFTTH